MASFQRVVVDDSEDVMDIVAALKDRLKLSISK